ncbi:integrator complex subunit 11 [Nematocida homosporus]|uniref:integrator complex subunit 11 n=1 Tax=Nematocida homosporus TaxID=1912981 RepID=UPI00221E61D4|nr:integrator complex subunit 11 [Nematocida homosporus]KAI5184796.1 integrator complex subunit 11 [Nematocida homosporus]
MQLRILGAGQDIGKSCVVVTMRNRTIMFDCGMHMGHTDSRKFPDFGLLGPRPYTGTVDCVLITHFHMDHCGGLPYFTEQCGYNGPIYMTPPTRAVLPIILQDYCKVYSEKDDTARNQATYSEQNVKDCMNKIQTISIEETIEIEPGFSITAYYAGHVLGAVMFHVQVGEESVVYTGDYNMSPDRHLDAAWLPNLRPSLLITECTYAQLVRDCRKEREREFVESVVSCVKKGGKVLIPVFALGRSHELCLLLDTHWEKTGMQVPIYTSATLTHKANEIYKQFIDYTHEHIRNNKHKRNLFDFQHVRPFESGYANAEGPMVLFSSPGMLHSGPSLSIFKKWCGDPKNLVIFPGYCVKGTIGEKVLNRAKKIETAGIVYPVNMQVKNMPFSAHADQRGIISLIQHCNPYRIVLVHGDIQRMKRLQQIIETKLGIPTMYPPNGAFFTLTPPPIVRALVSSEALASLQEKGPAPQEGELSGVFAPDDPRASLYIDSCAETVIYR